MAYSLEYGLFGTTGYIAAEEIFRKPSLVRARCRTHTISKSCSPARHMKKYHKPERVQKSLLVSPDLTENISKNSSYATEHLPLHLMLAEISAHGQPEKAQDESRLVPISCLYQRSGILFSLLETAIRQENIVDSIHGFQISLNENEVQLPQAGDDSDNFWIRNRTGATSIEEERKLRNDSMDRLLGIVREVFRPDGALTTHGNGNEISTQVETDVSLSSASNSGSSESSRAKKRKSEAEHDRPGDEDSESEQNPSHRPKKIPKQETMRSRRFACPYFKRSPHIYMHERSCAGPGWTSVHRVKEHLYRRHRLPPFRCNRCAWEFQNSKELALHQRSTQPCDLQMVEDQLEGVNSEQEAQLKSRKKDSTNKSEEEKWVDMYCILFPNIDPSDAPTPYYECPEIVSKDGVEDVDSKVDIAAYEAYLESELPSTLQQELERDVELELHMSDQALKERAVGLIRSLQPKLLKGFLSTQQSTVSNHLSTISDRASGLQLSNRVPNHNIPTALQEQGIENKRWPTGSGLEGLGGFQWPPPDENSLYTPRQGYGGPGSNTCQVNGAGPGKANAYEPNTFPGDSDPIELPDLMESDPPFSSHPVEDFPLWGQDFAIASEDSGWLPSSPGLDVMFSDMVDS
ncbi:hypothetical protein GGS26DRAFT_177639 [Hypomontagnella submonticulosa]|nr:hypothetical protein GGS26DRAFT_177639 [Hypomontagnella submonticulosa]